MATRREQAIRQAMDLDRKLLRLEKDTIARIRKDLEQARLQTLQRINLSTAQWDLAQSRQLLGELDRQIALFEKAAVNALNPALMQTGALGRERILTALQAGGLELGGPMISTAMLSVAETTAPWLIKEVGDVFRQQASSLLRQLSLGQVSTFEAMKQLGLTVPISGSNVSRTVFKTAAARRMGSSPFTSAFVRSEAIIRTEMGRVAMGASDAMLQDLGKNDPNLQKEWSAVGDMNTRPAHAWADGQVRKVSETFMVGGEKLRYPCDPMGSARNTCNCRCTVMPWHPMWDQFTPTPVNKTTGEPWRAQSRPRPAKVSHVNQSFVRDTVQAKSWLKSYDDTYWASAQQTLAKALQNATPTIRCPSSAVPRIIKDGRFKSQFETTSSMGAYDPAGRAAAERAMFGYADDLAAADRPIYGYMRLGAADSDAAAANYGGVAFELKPTVLSRTTVTSGDSLGIPGMYDASVTHPGAFVDSLCAPTPVLNPDPRAFYMGYEKGFVLTDSAQVETVLTKAVVYAEAQVHGGVTLADVSRAVLYRSQLAGDTEAVAVWLRGAGITVEIVP